ncbi:MAG: beta-lactamase family protein [Candidatus Riflebacteria bacterium]|nr:beta-lactamase family protein [Candidatus Riflebacteria bacterium]
MSRSTIGVTIALTALLLLLPRIAQGQVEGWTARRLIDARDLESFLDGIIGEHCGLAGVPGVALGVVQEGKLVLSKGYGYADVEARRPVDPGTTVFPVFSVTKSFTAMAVMALVERGQLDLARDVREYAPELAVPQAYGEPMTLHQILTHTTGLDKTLEGLLALRGDAVLPFLTFLREHPVPRVDPPGTLCQYDLGYSFAIAGHVMEKVAGKPYPELMRQLVLDPLEMTRSDFRLSRAQEPDLAWGYLQNPGDDRPRRTGRLHTQIAPAAVLHTTAQDMSHFLIAHLEGGLFRGRQVVSPRTLKRQHAAQHRPHPSFPGVAYGFFRGPGWVECVGGPFPHASLVLLVPGARVGLFMATDAVPGMLLMGRLRHRFLHRYFPETLDWGIRSDPAAGARSLEEFAGTYRLRFHSKRGLEKIGMLSPISLEMVVRPRGADRLELEETVLPISRELTRKGRDLFERTDGHGPVAFQRDERGVVKGFVTHPLLPIAVMPFTFERLSWLEWRSTNWVLLALFWATFLWVGAVEPAIAAIRALAGRRSGPARAGGRHRAHLVVVGILNLVVLVTPLLAIFPLVEVLPRLLFGVDAWVKALQRLGLVTLALDLSLPAVALHYWHRSGAGLPGRIGYVVVSLLAALFVPFCLYWNLVGL